MAKALTCMHEKYSANKLHRMIMKLLIAKMLSCKVAIMRSLCYNNCLKINNYAALIVVTLVRLTKPPRPN